MLPIIASMSRRRFTKSFSLHTELKNWQKIKHPTHQAVFQIEMLLFRVLLSYAPQLQRWMHNRLMLLLSQNQNSLHCIQFHPRMLNALPGRLHPGVVSQNAALPRSFSFFFTNLLRVSHPCVPFEQSAFRTIPLNAIFQSTVRIWFSWDQWEEIWSSLPISCGSFSFFISNKSWAIFHCFLIGFPYCSTFHGYFIVCYLSVLVSFSPFQIFIGVLVWKCIFCPLFILRCSPGLDTTTFEN